LLVAVEALARRRCPAALKPFCKHELFVAPHDIPRRNGRSRRFKRLLRFDPPGDYRQIVSVFEVAKWAAPISAVQRRQNLVASHGQLRWSVPIHRACSSETVEGFHSNLGGWTALILVSEGGFSAGHFLQRQ